MPPERGVEDLTTRAIGVDQSALVVDGDGCAFWNGLLALAFIEELDGEREIDGLIYLWG